MIVDRYYFGRLPEDEKTIYKEIYQGCMEHKDLIECSVKVKQEEDLTASFQRIMNALTYDNPLMYFLNQSVMDFAVDQNGNIAVMPQYFLTKEKVDSTNQKLQDAANKLIQTLKLTEGSDYDKVMKVHDYICKNIAYDHRGADSSDVTRFIATHNIIGVFAHKKAQCEGIAKAVKVLLNAVEVKCIYVAGDQKADDGTLTGHGWNIVNIDGTPYQLDVTADIGALSSDGSVSYDYLNVTDAQIRRNHILPSGLPKCTATDMNYFVVNDRIFSSKKKLQTFIDDQIKSGSTMFYYMLSGKLKASEILDETVQFAHEKLCEAGKDKLKPNYMINRYMNTCRITFR